MVALSWLSVETAVPSCLAKLVCLARLLQKLRSFPLHGSLRESVRFFTTHTIGSFLPLTVRFVSVAPAALAAAVMSDANAVFVVRS